MTQLELATVIKSLAPGAQFAIFNKDAKLDDPVFSVYEHNDYLISWKLTNLDPVPTAEQIEQAFNTPITTDKLSTSVEAQKLDTVESYKEDLRYVGLFNIYQEKNPYITFEQFITYLEELKAQIK